MEYRVTWKIDLDADSVEDAAQMALEIHRDRWSWATQFEVRDARGKVHPIDLGVPDESEKPDTLHVVISMQKGVVEDVRVYRSAEAAETEENQWLEANGIRTQQEREHHAGEGTEVSVRTCEVRR